MSPSSSSLSGESLCSGFIAVLPVQHAAISTLGSPFELETVCSSDPVAARLDELQMDLGEGPCWQARATGNPVLIRDLQVSPASTAWPGLLSTVDAHGIRSAYAFPLSVGTLEIGAVDLYATRPDALTDAHVAEATALASAAALQILQLALARVDQSPENMAWPRRVVHQATGMVIAQLGVSAEDALLIIRAHAFATNRTVREVADDVTARRLDFTL